MSEVFAAAAWVRIGASQDLIDGGPGLRFHMQAIDYAGQGQRVHAFAIRYHGQVYAYRNRCAHQALEIDWQQGRFFDLSGLYLICAVHGALYRPEDGYCIEGPCRGRNLQRITVIEHDHAIYWQPTPQFQPLS